MSDDEILNDLLNVKSFTLKVVNNDQFNVNDIDDEEALAILDKLTDHYEKKIKEKDLNG